MSTRKPRQPQAPCGNCGTTWPHSDRVGCCSACGRAFAGLAAFDAHQVGPRDERGRLRCVDPGTAIYPPGHRRYPDRVFRLSNPDRSDGKGQLWGLTPSESQAAWHAKQRALREAEAKDFPADPDDHA